MKDRLRHIIKEELEGMFSSSDSDSDGIPDYDEMIKNLGDEIKDTEDRINNLKKTVNFPTSTDASIAAKQKVVKKDQINNLEDMKDQKEDQIDQIKKMGSDMEKMQKAMSDTQDDQEIEDSVFNQAAEEENA